MLEQMKWEDVYELWKISAYSFSKKLTAPVSAETVFVAYAHDESYFYGYDWLENEEVQERKQLIEQEPLQFLYHTKPSNKGTIQPAEMLIEARTEEECAAVWIAATARELYEMELGCDAGRYAFVLYKTACEFLRSRYLLWSPAMKKLVPEIIIPLTVLKSIACKDAGPVMELIQMNTVWLKKAWRILRYSSLKDGESAEPTCRISSQ